MGEREIMSSKGKELAGRSSSRAGGIQTLSDLNGMSGPDSNSDSNGPQEYQNSSFACTTLPAPDSADNIGSSNMETMGQRLSVEPGTWRFPTNPDICCIYRVPNCMRHVNPEAYTPQLVLIGPLHHYLISQALKSREYITNTKSMGYLNMERHKKIYLEELAKRGGGTKQIEGFRRVIKEEEDRIRASYSESTAWIKSPEFVEMILHDSVFILEHILRCSEIKKYKKTGDPLIDEPCLGYTVKSDLTLLENQLPYFLLHKLFHPISLSLSLSLNTLVTSYFFDDETTIEDTSTFKHFTDLFRCIRVETLPKRLRGGEFDDMDNMHHDQTTIEDTSTFRHFTNLFRCIRGETLPKRLREGVFDHMDNMHHADKLRSGGVKFNVIDNKHSLEVEFKDGCLNIPIFLVDDNLEMTLRNIMALEQCHYAFRTHVCNYIWFLDFLIDSEKDVELLVEKGIIRNLLGNHGSVATMVNRLCLGVSSFGSYHSVIAEDVTNHYNNRWNKSRAVLKSVYFSNLWRGTATVAATLLLLLTLVQTVSSVIQILK